MVQYEGEQILFKDYFGDMEDGKNSLVDHSPFGRMIIFLIRKSIMGHHAQSPCILSHKDFGWTHCV